MLKKKRYSITLVKVTKQTLFRTIKIDMGAQQWDFTVGKRDWFQLQI